MLFQKIVKITSNYVKLVPIQTTLFCWNYELNLKLDFRQRLGTGTVRNGNGQERERSGTGTVRKGNGIELNGYGRERDGNGTERELCGNEIITVHIGKYENS